MKNNHPLQTALTRLRQPDGWCLSAIIRTERGFQDHKKTAAKLKEIEHQLRIQLEEHVDKDTAKQYSQRFLDLTQDLDFTGTKDGVGIYMDEKEGRIVHFGFPVDNNIIIDRSFEIRDVLFGVSRLVPYYALILGKEDARLYFGVGDQLMRVSDRNDLSEEERIYDDPHGAWKFSKSRGDNDNWHGFLDNIDQLLGQYIHRKQHPFFVMGTEADVNYFANHTDHGDWLAGKISGSFDHIADEKLFEELEEGLTELAGRRVAEVLDHLSNNSNNAKHAQGIQDVWTLANEGRVQTLMIERNYRKPGYSTDDESSIFYEPNDMATVFHKDAIDDLAEKVLSLQGEVVFANAGTIDDYGHVAAILRY